MKLIKKMKNYYNIKFFQSNNKKQLINCNYKIKIKYNNLMT